jgi:hypothetical protein
MIDRFIEGDPTPEDLATRAIWARRLGVVYACVLLLLLALVTAQRLAVESNGASGVASASEVHVAR